MAGQLMLMMLVMLVSWAHSEVKGWAADAHDARVLARSEVKGWAADAHDACVWARSEVKGWAADAHDAEVKG